MAHRAATSPFAPSQSHRRASAGTRLARPQFSARRRGERASPRRARKCPARVQHPHSAAPPSAAWNAPPSRRTMHAHALPESVIRTATLRSAARRARTASSAADASESRKARARRDAAPATRPPKVQTAPSMPRRPRPIPPRWQLSIAPARSQSRRPTGAPAEPWAAPTAIRALPAATARSMASRRPEDEPRSRYRERIRGASTVLSACRRRSSPHLRAP